MFESDYSSDHSYYSRNYSSIRSVPWFSDYTIDDRVWKFLIKTAMPKPYRKQSNLLIFWGELIDKYKDINANSKTVFTDYAMLKLVHIVPTYF